MTKAQLSDHSNDAVSDAASDTASEASLSVSGGAFEAKNIGSKDSTPERKVRIIDSSLDAPLPYSPFSEKRKVIIVIVIAITSLISPLAANMYYPAIQQARDELHTTDSGIDTTMSSFTFSQAVFPLLWSMLADNYGRRFVYIGSLVVYIAGSIGCATSNNLGEMIASRIIQACGASAVQGAGAGTISDIYERERRGTALGLYYLGPLFGTAIAPLIGGYSAESLGYRWVFWILAIFGGVMTVATYFGLPETHRRIVSQKYKIQQVGIPKKLGIRKSNPLLSIAYIRFPNVMVVCFQLAMVFGMMLGLSSVNPLAFQNIYGLSQGTTGLCYLGMGAGSVIGSFVGGRITDIRIRRERRLYKKEKQEGRIEEGKELKTNLELRLQDAWIGGFFFLIGTFMVGWLIQKKVHLSGILISQFFVGLGTSYQFSQMSSYFLDIFPTAAASITSVQNFVRNIWAGICIEILPTMLDNIGWGWSFTIFGFLALIGSVLVQLVAMKGEYIRTRTNFVRV